MKTKIVPALHLTLLPHLPTIGFAFVEMVDSVAQRAANLDDFFGG